MSHTLELRVAIGVAMLVGSASDIDTVGAIDQSEARVCSLSCSGILRYYALRGCRRLRELCVRKGVMCSRRQLSAFSRNAVFEKYIMLAVRHVG
jgi:hypothetical protein